MPVKKTGKTARGRRPAGRGKKNISGRAGSVKVRRRAPVVKLPPGRPTVCTEAAALRVLQGIMEGDCLELACNPEDGPCKRTWLRWVAADVNLQMRYVAAMQIRALSRADECVPIADDVKEDKGAVLKANLRIRTRQWEIMRLANKVYGKDGVVLPPPSPGSGQTAMSDPEVELRLKSLRDELKGKR